MGRVLGIRWASAQPRHPLLTEQWHTVAARWHTAGWSSVPHPRSSEDGAPIAQAHPVCAFEDTGPLRADPCHPLRDARVRMLHATVATLLIAIAGASGCGTGKERSQATDGALPLSVHAEEGSTAITLTIRPGSPMAGSRAELELRVVADKSGTLEIEDYQRSVENAERHFEYRLEAGERRAGVPSADGKREWSAKFRVEFLLAGEYEFPAARVTVTPAATEAANSGSSEPIVVATTPLKVTVTEAPGAPLTPDELRALPMPPPVDLPRPWPRFWPAYAAIGAVAAVALAAFLVARRRRREFAAVIIPAHEWARRMFTELIADDLLARDRTQEFFYRISGIVRGYIERRFGLTAAEMTTEEFLSAATSDARFSGHHTAALDPFLRACDLVKYAKHQPRPADADESLHAAQGFVEETREREDGTGTSSANSDASNGSERRP